MAAHHKILPHDVKLTEHTDMSRVTYQGKPIPRNVRTQDGFQSRNTKPDQVVRDGRWSYVPLHPRVPPPYRTHQG